jgi:hypothetical protein
MGHRQRRGLDGTQQEGEYMSSKDGEDRWCDASGKVHFGKLKPSQISKFEGKAGTYRKYLAGENTVLWYKVTP